MGIPTLCHGRFGARMEQSGSWRPGLDECGWAGITCDNNNRTIMAMDLPSAELKGTISAYIEKLTDLRTRSTCIAISCRGLFFGSRCYDI